VDRPSRPSISLGACRVHAPNTHRCDAAPGDVDSVYSSDALTRNITVLSGGLAVKEQ